jgi:hypothetical protein
VRVFGQWERGSSGHQSGVSTHRTRAGAGRRAPRSATVGLPPCCLTCWTGIQGGSGKGRMGAGQPSGFRLSLCGVTSLPASSPYIRALCTHPYQSSIPPIVPPAQPGHAPDHPPESRVRLTTSRNHHDAAVPGARGAGCGIRWGTISRGGRAGGAGREAVATRSCTRHNSLLQLLIAPTCPRHLPAHHVHPTPLQLHQPPPLAPR